MPLLKIRSLRDYFAPLDGCPRCGYAYERETGYFLLAIWAINYGVESRLGSKCERLALFRGLRYHVEDRVLVHGNQAIVFQD
jgi:hypothetical protein